MEKDRGLRGLLILLVLVFLAAVAAMIYLTDNPSLLPRADMYFDKNPAMDRIRVYAFGYDGNVLLGEVTEPQLIQQYIAAHRWEDPYRICCDEMTEYVFEEYAQGVRVGSSKLARGKAKYNNRAFIAVQRKLLAYMEVLPTDEAAR